MFQKMNCTLVQCCFTSQLKQIRQIQGIARKWECQKGWQRCNSPSDRDCTGAEANREAVGSSFEGGMVQIFWSCWPSCPEGLTKPHRSLIHLGKQENPLHVSLRKSRGSFWVYPTDGSQMLNDKN